MASHHLVAGSRVDGTPVFGASGEKLGKVAELMIDKISGTATYALMSFDGIFGFGERYYPIPWAMLDYDPNKRGFVTKLTKAQIEQGHHVDDKEIEDEIEWREAVHGYYGVPAYWALAPSGF